MHAQIKDVDVPVILGSDEMVDLKNKDLPNSVLKIYAAIRCTEEGNANLNISKDILKFK